MSADCQDRDGGADNQEKNPFDMYHGELAVRSDGRIPQKNDGDFGPVVTPQCQWHPAQYCVSACACERVRGSEKKESEKKNVGK